MAASLANDRVHARYRSLSHRWILGGLPRRDPRYYDAWEESDQLYIQMELCPGYSLLA